MDEEEALVLGLRRLAGIEHLEEVFGFPAARAPAVKHLDQIGVVLLVFAVFEIEFIEVVGPEQIIARTRTTDVFVERERLELPATRFVKGEGVQAAQDGAGVVTLAVEVLLVQEVASGGYAPQCHHVAISADPQPRRIRLVDFLDFVRAHELDEFVRVRACFPGEPDDVPWGGKTYDIAATMAAVNALETYC